MIIFRSALLALIFKLSFKYIACNESCNDTKNRNYGGYGNNGFAGFGGQGGGGNGNGNGNGLADGSDGLTMLDSIAAGNRPPLDFNFNNIGKFSLKSL